MYKRKFLIFACILSTVFAVFWGVVRVKAAQTSRVNELVPFSRDTEAILQRRSRRPTPQQRAEAAARLRAAREKKDPTLAAYRKAARDRATYTAALRIAALAEDKSPNPEIRKGASARFRAAHSAAILEAKARAKAARIAAGPGAATLDQTILGGVNE